MQFSLTEHQEVNVKGVYLNVITLSTGTLGDIYPNFGSYIPSKLAQTKFMEFLHEGKLTLCRNPYSCALTNTF
jgi:hypothetical protein